MQEIIAHIFKEMGGATALANGLGLRVQTVHSWLGTKDDRAEIPPWRRPAVLALAQRNAEVFGKLSPEAITYLASTERAPRKASEPQADAA